jgi:bifunctional aspartokinase / homoserine dehydrogenase 1
MKVLKFGGTSVGSPERIRGVKKIIEAQSSPCVVVVSAFQGITDELNEISELASVRNDEYKGRLEKVVIKHTEFLKQLIHKKKQETALESINKIFNDLRETLRGIYLLRELSRHSRDEVLGTGEMLSSIIISSTIDSVHLDSRNFIKTDSNFGFANVDFALTDNLIRKLIKQTKKHIIVPGFIASNQRNETTTLGRGGSDYTAAIIAAALDAEFLEIWTDVDGFMTADPRKVDKAYPIESLTYSEAIELSHFGAKVIYTPTLRPVYKKNIPVKVLNTFNPGSKGTTISQKSSDDNKSPIKGISSIDHIDLITLQGTGIVGVSGTSMRLFGILAGQNINIILITQASSEYSISFGINPSDSARASEAINQEFINDEVNLNREFKVLIEKNLSIIAIVGERMKNTPGISATLFRALGRNGINVIATAQGSSELNISVVIKNESLKKALNVIHDGFFLSRYKEMYIFIAGTGLVGSSLLTQIQKQYSTLLSEHSLKINLMGVINSRKMLIDKKGISLENYGEALVTSGEKGDISLFIQQMTRLNLRNSVFIDCTADEIVATKYADILSRYVSIVTANKIACSSEFNYYQKLRTLANERGVRFMYETTVGAGLPIIKTISDLVVSGDKILKIEAVLSGTMNFIFNELSPEMPLSAAIRKARERGYSEPDPRVDLSGTDVVRKILILAREAGYPIEKEDVIVSKFLPDECFEGDLNDFFEKVKKYDAEFEQKRKELAKQNRKWRFFATLDQGKAKVELLTIGSEHPSFNLEGSNNIILFTTNMYHELPMVIKGYGAGAEVTAAGVFADLMRVVNF